MSKVSMRPAIVMPTMARHKAITAAAKAAPDAQPLTPTQLQAMVPMKAVRGRPKSENKKQLVSIRYSPRGRGVLQINRRGLAVAHGWRAAAVPSTALAASVRPSLTMASDGRP
jgi:uncharacterized protein (DUF4415 family)